MLSLDMALIQPVMSDIHTNATYHCWAIQILKILLRTCFLK